MKKTDFDEYQVMNRQKIAFQTLIINLLIILINGIISGSYQWASPMTQALIIILISTGYFVTCATFKNAYLSNNVKKPYSNTILFAVLGILHMIVFFTSSRKIEITYIIDNGKLSDKVIPLLMAIFLIYISIIILIKYILDRRNSNDS